MINMLNDYIRAIISLLIKNIWRWRWRLSLVAFLVTGSLTIAVLYGSIIRQESTDSLAQIRSLNLPFEAMVILQDGQPAKDIAKYEIGTFTIPVIDKNTGGISKHLYDSCVITSYLNVLSATVQSPLGEIEIWGLVQVEDFFELGDWKLEGETPTDLTDLWLPTTYKDQYHLKIGDEIQLTYINQNGVKVSDIFTICGFGTGGYDLESPIITMSAVQTIARQTEPNLQLLTITNLSNMNDYNRFIERMDNIYPDSNLVFGQLPQELWKSLMGAVQSPSNWVILLVFLFLSIAVLTISLMTFFERKRELAVLKAIGVSNGQVGLVVFLEYFLSGLAGYVSGVVTVLFVNQIFWGEELAIAEMLPQLFSRYGLYTLVFLILAVLYPILLVRIATVNQLLFSRSIPLVVKRHSSILSPSVDWRQEMQENNVSMLKLVVADGKLLSTLLKNPGEMVKKGEVVAIMTSFAGFYYQEWLSPCDGKIVSFDVNNGKLVFKPAEEAETT